MSWWPKQMPKIFNDGYREGRVVVKVESVVIHGMDSYADAASDWRQR